MKVASLLTIKELELLTEKISLDRDISDFYSCDLLSWAMGHITKPNVVLLTILNSINVIAVASLHDMPAVIFCESVIPTDDILKKANEENIVIFTTKLNSIEIAQILFKNENIL